MTVVVVFPGQGSQRPGMARDFCRQFPVSRRTLEEAGEACGVDMTRLCCGDDPRLARTEFTQPAILATEIAIVRAVREEYGLRPTHFAGHSVGEYAALVAAGVLPLREAIALVRTRGTMMSGQLPAGRGGMMAMLSRDASVADVRRCLDGLAVDIAAVNAPGQIVLSGLLEDLAAARSRLGRAPATAGARFRSLPGSVPFHSRFMAPVEPGFRRELEAASASWVPELARSVACNVTGDFHDPARPAIIDALTRQVSGQVRWLGNMRALARLSPARIVEIGPRSVLRGFFRVVGQRIDPVTTVAEARQVLGSPRSEKATTR